MDNIWGVDLANVHLIDKYNRGIPFLCFIVFIKYAWVIPLKDKKGINQTKCGLTKL